MKTPFEVLEIAEDADDETIKKAYLRKVRDYPPERDGEAFQRIRKAYELIQTDKDRIQYSLFYHERPNISTLNASALVACDIQRPEVKVITTALAESALNTLIKRLGGSVN